MENYADHLINDWKLSKVFRNHLTALPLAHLQSCYDINTALKQLLGSADLVRKWVWQPMPWLYHVRPVEVVLASRFGCDHIRFCLLKDLADLREDFGVYAAIESPLRLNVAASPCP